MTGISLANPWYNSIAVEDCNRKFSSKNFFILSVRNREWSVLNGEYGKVKTNIWNLYLLKRYSNFKDSWIIKMKRKPSIVIDGSTDKFRCLFLFGLETTALYHA